MRPTIHTTLLISAVILAYIWLKTPMLQPYSIQAIAVSTLSYFIFKKTKIWQILPSESSYALVFVTFSLLLVIGNTGNLNSPLYPLTYIHLFFLVMTSTSLVAALVMAAASLFHLILAPEIDLGVLVHIITLPIVMIFFLFAKQQHEELTIKKQTLQNEETVISSQENGLTILRNQLIDLKNRQEHAESKFVEMKTLLESTLQTIKTWQVQFFGCEPQIHSQIEQVITSIKNTLDSSTTNQEKVNNSNHDNRQTP